MYICAQRAQKVNCMTICGVTVFHKSFGKGTVSHCEGTVVTVAFSLLDGSTQEKKFIFPDAFMQRLLESSDLRVEEYIRKYIQDNTCAVCGWENVSTQAIDGKRLCKSCEGKHTKKCPECGQIHLKENFSSVHLSESPYYASMCNDCYSLYIHRCDRCHTSFISKTPVHSFNGKTYCNRCYERLISTCPICGEVYWDEQGKTLVKDEEHIRACPKCIQKKSFLCSICEQHVANEELVDSKYIPAEKKICKSCVDYCNSCGEPVDSEHSCTYFWKTYCKDCEASKKMECTICGEEFIPEEEGQNLCPECMDSVAYLQKLKEIDFSAQHSKVMSVYSLDNMDRCKLFTNLYENCRSLSTGQPPCNEDEPFHYLVMSVPGYQAVVTYLPREITARVKHSANVTMTELRSQKGRFRVHAAIEQWLEESDQTLTICEGEVQLLHYPVLIRAQTQYDKVYGKEWNGPDDYIEIGNYGDTTEFHIIGILK